MHRDRLPLIDSIPHTIIQPDSIHRPTDCARKSGPILSPHKSNADGRIRIALAFNQAIRVNKIGPVVLGRDHHDVSGTDSPYRETSNIYDGSRFTADMAIHNVIGDSFRGATWVSIHNGGGVGWGEVINGGFGMLLDGTEATDRKLKSMLYFDVNNGIARRAWAQNPGALFTIEKELSEFMQVTIPYPADPTLLDDLI
jgi:urocanate hydratase